MSGVGGGLDTGAGSLEAPAPLAPAAATPPNMASTPTASAPPRNICFNATPSTATLDAKPKRGPQVFLFLLAARERPE